MLVATRVGANTAHVQFGQRVAFAAVTDLGQRQLQRFGQLQTTVAIALKQLKRHTLRQFWADPGQTTQTLHQLVDQGTELH